MDWNYSPIPSNNSVTRSIEVSLQSTDTREEIRSKGKLDTPVTTLASYLALLLLIFSYFFLMAHGVRLRTLLEPSSLALYLNSPSHVCTVLHWHSPKQFSLIPFAICDSMVVKATKWRWKSHGLFHTLHPCLDLNPRQSWSNMRMTLHSCDVVVSL